MYLYSNDSGCNGAWYAERRCVSSSKLVLSAVGCLVTVSDNNGIPSLQIQWRTSFQASLQEQLSWPQPRNQRQMFQQYWHFEYQVGVIPMNKRYPIILQRVTKAVAWLASTMGLASITSRSYLLVLIFLLNPMRREVQCVGKEIHPILMTRKRNIFIEVLPETLNPFFGSLRKFQGIELRAHKETRQHL
jgi:hypothetical protein